MFYTGDRDIARPKALSSSLPSGPRVGDREEKDSGEETKAIRRNAELVAMGFNDPNDETHMGTSEPEPKKKKWPSCWTKSFPT